MSAYYDIDAILTDAHKVPCTFELEIPGLGYIDGNAGSDVRSPTPLVRALDCYAQWFEQIKQGSRVTIPLWLCELLAVQRVADSQVLSLDLPASLSPRVLNALKADARTVDLRTLASHFYRLAARILDLFEEEEIVDVLSEVGRPKYPVSFWDGDDTCSD